MSVVTEKALKEFLGEVEDLLSGMEEDLFSLEEKIREGEEDPDLINRLFRGAHSLKGLAGMFGFRHYSELAHRLEDLLDALRLGKVPVEERSLGILREGIGKLKEGMGVFAESHSDLPPDFSTPFFGKLERFLKVESREGKEDLLGRAGVEKEIRNVFTEYEEHRFQENLRKGRTVYRVKVIFPLTTFDQDLTKVMEEVKKRGEFITTLPAPEVLGENVLGFFLVFSSDLLEEEILEILSPYTPEIKGRYRLGKDLPSPQKQVSVESVKSLSQTVRVDIQKLDYVLSLVGELMMVRGAIQRLVDQMDSEYGLSHLTGEFKKVVRVFERRLQELQKRVMEVRMVPLRQIFDRMQRAVRQISQGMGKKIRVEIKGAETELDKLLVEELADPLLHILRNAVDHGIEPPSERKEKGKPDEGHIVLSAYQKGNHVVVEVQDDGRGISLEKIQRKALEKGWITPDQILTKKEILDFIFRPGFSTKEGVDELSGRGVGMDVVKNNITRLGGIVDIETEEGKGTKVILTLPVTLAIIQALVVQTSGNTYAIPLNSVLETFQISRKEIQRVDTQEILIHRGNPLPLIRLERIFQLVRMEKEPEDGYVVFVGLGEKRAGFLVDHLHGEQDVVLKPLQSILKKVPGIAGASDQGENPPILILDVAEILVEAGI